MQIELKFVGLRSPQPLYYSTGRWIPFPELQQRRWIKNNIIDSIIHPWGFHLWHVFQLYLLMPPPLSPAAANCPLNLFSVQHTANR